MKRIQCTLNNVCFPKGWLSSNPDIKKFVGNHYAKYENGSSFNMAWSPATSIHQAFFKLD